VNLDPDRYALLKDSCEGRMQKMIDYVREEDICRSSYLLEYFGQTESSDCGTCDICRASKGDLAKKEDRVAALRRMIDEGVMPPPEV
jgi:ATP-dependent DNA helicase RecQ